MVNFAKLKNLGSDLLGRAGELAEQAKEKAGPLAEQAKERAGDIAGQAKEKAGPLAEKARDAAVKGYDKAVDTFDSATNRKPSDKDAAEPAATTEPTSVETDDAPGAVESALTPAEETPEGESEIEIEKSA